MPYIHPVSTSWTLWTPFPVIPESLTRKLYIKKIPELVKMVSMVPGAVSLIPAKTPVCARPGARSCSGQLSNGMRSPAQGWTVTRRPGQPPGFGGDGLGLGLPVPEYPRPLFQPIAQRHYASNEGDEKHAERKTGAGSFRNCKYPECSSCRIVWRV